MSVTPPEGWLVALETSGPVGSVAIARSGEVVARSFFASERGHAADLIPALDEVMGAAGADRSELAGVAVGAGPGSFTGVRVAAATAKGLAHALGVPLWAVSSLEAAAVSGPAILPPGAGPWAAPALEDLVREDPFKEPVRYVLFDARGDRVYAACYRLTLAGLEVLHPPRATRLDDVLSDPLPEHARFAGEGAVRHRARILRQGGLVLPPPVGMPTADGVLRLVSGSPARRPVDEPRRWEPEYLRASSAERARSP